MQSNFKTMSLCLLLICLVCSALMAVVYAFTKAPVEVAEVRKTSMAIAKVVPEFDGEPLVCTVDVDGDEHSYYSVSKDGEVVGYAVEAVSSGFGGALKIMVGFTTEGIIHNVAVLDNSQETPGLGAKSKDEPFIGQFSKFDPSVKKLSVTKDGGDVDAITAATITSRAFCVAVGNALAVYNSIISNCEDGSEDSSCEEGCLEGEGTELNDGGTENE